MVLPKNGKQVHFNRLECNKNVTYIKLKVHDTHMTLENDGK
jgi:hypothetical protein